MECLLRKGRHSLKGPLARCLGHVEAKALGASGQVHMGYS